LLKEARLSDFLSLNHPHAMCFSQSIPKSFHEYVESLARSQLAIPTRNAARMKEPPIAC